MADRPVRMVSQEEFALLTARPEMRIITICIAVAATGIVQGLLFGWDAGAVWLIAGAIGASVGMLLFGGVFAGMAPYVFGCYLVFLRGLWNGRVLLDSFSLGRVATVVAFVYLGQRLVYWAWQLTEIGRAVSTGRLVVAETKSAP